jgi:hypothetical protein
MCPSIATHNDNNQYLEAYIINVSKTLKENVIDYQCLIALGSPS